jgi:ribonuclease T2
MTRSRIQFLTPAVLALCTALAAQAPAPFDYYVLSLSWAPDFCAQPGAAAANPKECAAGRGTGFVVHGLWPEAAQGKSPESCGPSKSAAKNVVKIALPYMLSDGLIQHEWATHGTCTGLSPADYFFDVIQARSAVQIPVQMISVEVPLTESPVQIEEQFAAANAAFPKNAFRTACRNGALSEVRVCFTRDLKPAACPASLGECLDPAVSVRPVR